MQISFRHFGAGLNTRRASPSAKWHARVHAQSRENEPIRRAVTTPRPLVFVHFFAFFFGGVAGFLPVVRGFDALALPAPDGLADLATAGGGAEAFNSG